MVSVFVSYFEGDREAVAQIRIEVATSEGRFSGRDRDRQPVSMPATIPVSGGVRF